MRYLRLFTALFLAATVATQAQSIVDRRGAPKTVGNQIVDKDGKPLQLTGMSFFWNQYTEGAIYYNKDVVNWLVKDWKCNVLRAAMGVNSNGSYKSANVMAVVDAAIANGIYVIIDWHEEMAVNHTAQSKAFFTSMAQKYGKYPNVIFEIYNEPHNANVDLNPTWDAISAYAQEVISGIREYSQNLVIVGTTNYSQGVDEAAAAPLDPSLGNVAYTLHFYSGTHKSNLRNAAQGAITSGIPIFVTEWGTTTSDGGQLTGTSKGAIYPAESDLWIAFMNKYKISSCNWSISNKAEGASAIKPSAATNGFWNDTDLTPSGTYVRKFIQAQCANDPNVCPWSGDTAGASSIPGAVDLSQYSLNFGLSKTVPVAPSTTVGLTSVDSADWARYFVASTDLLDTLEVRALVTVPTQGGTIAVTLNGATVSIPVKPVNDATTQFWAYGLGKFIVPAGQFPLDLQFQGLGKDLLKILKLEFVKAPSTSISSLGAIPMDGYLTTPKSMNIVSLEDNLGVFLHRIKNTASVTYALTIPQDGTYTLSGFSGSASNGGQLTVKMGFSNKTIAIPGGSSWLGWTPFTATADLVAGTTNITLTASGDTSSLFTLAGLRLDQGTAVHPNLAANQVRLTRTPTGLNLSLGRTNEFKDAQLVSADGRILARMDVTDLSEVRLQAPNSSLPLWIRLQGLRSATLAVPPLR